MTDLAKFKLFAEEMGLDVDIYVKKRTGKKQYKRCLELRLHHSNYEIFNFSSNGKLLGLIHVNPYDDKEPDCYSPVFDQDRKIRN